MLDELKTEAEEQYIMLELLWVGENELLFEVMMTAADGGLDLERLVRTTNSSLESIGKMYTLYIPHFISKSHRSNCQKK